MSSPCTMQPMYTLAISALILPLLTAANPSNVFTLSPNLDAPLGVSNAIANDFISISIAIHWFQDYAREGQGSQPNEFSRNLLQSLADSTSLPPRIRIGGTSADRTTYIPTQQDPILTVAGDNGIPVNVTLGPLWFQQCFDPANFPDGTRFTFDLPLVRNDSLALNNTLTGAGWALNAIGKERFDAFEIGNEEDLYTSQGVVPSSWTVKDYVERWRTFSRSIQEKVLSPAGFEADKKWFQGLVFAGLGNIPAWTTATAFNAGVDEDGFIKSVSLHNYPVGSAPWVTLGRTFMNHAAIVANLSQVIDDIAFLGSSQSTQNIDFILGETNSDFVNLNMAQFEGVLGSALWTIDYILYGAYLNIKRMNIHQGTTFGYAAWQPVAVNDKQPQVRAPFYGLKFAAEALGRHHGSTQIIPIDVGEAHLSTYAIYESKELARLAIVNFQEWNATDGPRPSDELRLDLGGTRRAVRTRLLTAPAGASADSGLTFGGIMWNFTTGGLPARVPDIEGERTVKIDRDGIFRVNIGASEALLISVEE
ncbi:hypothetical protein D9758_003148 [Tetrapyrgos nigripes]|uniref:Beta-glucuronidase C-terminal domain-containing protein n=1 Tax=Tetrapyrgos nigripes TaxID=182062 RepID=A0A8H5LQG0_9AGAR|nr:hypothetical protein D9758_003148 [Tetrapyrgos nigripes]